MPAAIAFASAASSGTQKLAGELLKGHQLVVPDVVAIAFREPVHEERPLADPQQDQGAEAAGFSAGARSAA